ncbi:signal peptidase I [Microbacterium paludicola]|nr:signal peptidase I [Microbacterium paludicola]
MTASPDAAPARRRWRRAASHPLAHLAAAVLVIALVQSFAVKVYQVPSASMEQTLMPGDRILVDRLGIAGPPSRGDVVVFERPESWRDAPRAEESPWRSAAGWFGDVFGFGPSNGDALVKRIVAGPGETVACCDAVGRLTIDDEPLDEPYVTHDLPFESGVLDCDTAPRSSRCFPPIHLGSDEYLLLGDSRANSADSLAACRGGASADTASCARPVDREQIIGEAFFRFWPVTRWGMP